MWKYQFDTLNRCTFSFSTGRLMTCLATTTQQDSPGGHERRGKGINHPVQPSQVLRRVPKLFIPSKLTRSPLSPVQQLSTGRAVSGSKISGDHVRRKACFVETVVKRGQDAFRRLFHCERIERQRLNEKSDGRKAKLSKGAEVERCESKGEGIERQRYRTAKVTVS